MASENSVKAIVEEIASIQSDLPSDGSLQPKARKKLQGLAKELGFALESPFETMNRLTFLPLEHTVVRVAINLGLFEYLLEAGPSGKTLDEIKAQTGVDEVLLPRILRTLASIGLLSQIDQHRWKATSLAQSCIIPPLRSGFNFMFDFVGPVFQKMPESLAKRNYQCPTALQGPLQDAYDTELVGYDYLMEPRWADTLMDCNIFMKGRREGSISWLDFYPFTENILSGQDHESSAVTVVDVGGGLGHGLMEIKGKFPDMKGRLVLQDLPSTIQQAGDGGGVFEPMSHDFFTPQPIKGSKAYLIRQVLHDWPEKECQTILQHLAAAMRPGYSKVLVNEFIVPEVGASDFIVACDLVMMGLNGGMERTESQWTSLLASAGLRIEKIWTLNEQTESVIEAVLV
ncbi:MAG: hypothetical protein LQ338_002620 [Usnochroma carphineum]|nr:MAG: hypothetical protein LQ338_002620 [Usnochroma carphineum]